MNIQLRAPQAGAQREQLYQVLLRHALRREAEHKAVESALASESRRKDVFLATIAHELRNCMAALGGGLDMLERGAEPGGRTGALAITRRQFTLMEYLLRDMTDAGRIVNGQFTLESRPLVLQELVEAAVAACRPALRELQLGVDLPAAPVRIHGDANRLSQVLTNLLDNAAKFTPPGGHVSVRVRAGDRAELSVSDDGAGIAAHDLQRIFELFGQEQRSRSLSPCGLGIGLAVVRHVVELHAGSVAAQSDGPGRGATFTVTLPLLAAQAAQEPTVAQPLGICLRPAGAPEPASLPL